MATAKAPAPRGRSREAPSGSVSIAAARLPQTAVRRHAASDRVELADADRARKRARMAGVVAGGVATDAPRAPARIALLALVAGGGFAPPPPAPDAGVRRRTILIARAGATAELRQRIASERRADLGRPLLAAARGVATLEPGRHAVGARRLAAVGARRPRRAGALIAGQVARHADAVARGDAADALRAVVARALGVAGAGLARRAHAAAVHAGGRGAVRVDFAGGETCGGRRIATERGADGGRGSVADPVTSAELSPRDDVAVASARKAARGSDGPDAACPRTVTQS